MASLSFAHFIEQGHKFALSVVYVEGLTEKYAFMAFIEQTTFSVSPEKFAGSAALISMVLVLVDIGFVGVVQGWQGVVVVEQWTRV